ncbi:RHS repeat-associated core domain-containing protein [Pseudomonas sp. NPDC090202]|uniref:RHS repeat-associated core domain-containing protein n=1 Tax=unclassified Pseudomonas TaxID=196821 RepID=UPI0037F3436E
MTDISASSPEQTQFEYDADGQPSRTVAPDGLETLTLWYPRDGSSIAAPDVRALIAGLTLADGRKLATLNVTTCPALPAFSHARLLAQFRRLPFPDGSASEGELALYGYGGDGEKEERRVQLELTGVDVIAGDGGTWTVQLSPGRQAPEVSLTEETVFRQTEDASVSRAAGLGITTTRTATRWYKSDDARQTQTLTEKQSVLPGGLARLSVTTSPLPGGGEAIIRQHVTSAFSGVLLRESKQDGNGLPVTFTVINSNSRGQVRSQTLYAWDESRFRSGDVVGLTPLETTDESVCESLPTGTWERTCGDDGRWAYICYDGLRRPVSQWLQRMPGEVHSEANRLCVERRTYGPDGQIAEEEVYDWLPGGRCVWVEGGRAPDAADAGAWFWVAEQRQSMQSEDGRTRALSITSLQGEAASGRVTGSVVTVQTNRADGSVAVNETARAGELDTGRVLSASQQDTNVKGQVTAVTETVTTGKGDVARRWKMNYDDLGRCTTITAPDGRVVTRSYQGLSEMPLRVTLTHKGKTWTLGSRELSGDGNGADGSRVFAQEEAGGSVVGVYKQFSDGTKTRFASFRINPVTRIMRSERAAGPDGHMVVINESFLPKLYGESWLRRRIGGFTERTQLMTSLRGRVTSGRSAAGVSPVHRRNARGMPQSVRRGELDYGYDWTAKGQLAGVSVRDLRNGRMLEVNYGYDDAGNEITREQRLDGLLKARWVQTWTAQSQVQTRTLYRDGAEVPARTETYTYETQRSGLRDELMTWSVEAIDSQDAVLDRDGKAIRSQAYTYDALGNMLTCSTTFADGTLQRRTYAYDDAEQPSRRTAESVEGKTLTLTYDAAGNLQSDAESAYRYTPEGQLASVSDLKNGTLRTRYEYDAEGVLVAVWDEATNTRQICLSGAVTRVGADDTVRERIIRDVDGLVSVVQTFPGESVFFLLAGPGAGGGDAWCADVKGNWTCTATSAFTPWGESPQQHVATPGWNGLHADPAGLYHLGEGYRAYSPALRTFCQPDSLSPFGSGGLNERAYCAGRDPVNWHDPSGHIMLNRTAAGEQLASLDQWVTDTNPPPPQAAAWWEWLLLGVGAVVALAVIVMSGGALLFVVGGILMLAGSVIMGVGMGIRQRDPELAAKLELAGGIVSGVGGLLIPTGAGFIAAAIIRTAAAASIALSIASYAVRESNPELAEKLGWASMGLGMVDAAHGIAKGAAKRGRKGLERLRSLRSRIVINRKLERIASDFRLNALPAYTESRLPSFGDLSRQVRQSHGQKDFGGAARWKSISTQADGHTVNHHVTTTELQGNEIVPQITKINSSGLKPGDNITVVTGGHGAFDGDNWIKSGSDILRKPGLRDSKFLVSDTELMHQVQGVFPANPIDVINMHFPKAMDRIKEAQTKAGHIIYAYCYSANDEFLRWRYNWDVSTSYVRNQTTWDMIMI